MKPNIERILDYTVKAPSGHNTQPWKFRILDRSIIIYPDLTRRLPIVDPDLHSLFISLGCALENLVIAASHYGFAAHIGLNFEDGSDHIKVNLTPAVASRHDELFDSINIRQTTRNNYNGKPIPARDLEKLRAASQQEDVEFLLLTDPAEIKPLLCLSREAVYLQLQRPEFLKELKTWVRFNRHAGVKTGDGLYGGSTGNPLVPGWLGKLALGFFVSPEKIAKKYEEQLLSSSAIMIFVAARHDKKAWVNLGRSFERVALTATSLEINLAHMNMPCEEITIREKLRKQLRLAAGKQPLLLSRIGYSYRMPYSFRRPLTEVILQN